MKKVGAFTMAGGLLLFLLLSLARSSDWYTGERARSMSDFVELIESAYRASLVTGVFGLVLLLLGLRPGRQALENDTPTPLVRSWICPACGGENSQHELRCRLCGNPRNHNAQVSWQCPFCGSENPESAQLCAVCQSPRTRPGNTWICEGCGAENAESEDRCQAGQRRRGPRSQGWSCPVCGGSNPLGSQICQFCGSVRNARGWRCGYCQAENRENSRVCAVCGRPKDQPGGSWLCPVCGTENRAARTVCAGCGQARPVDN